MKQIKLKSLVPITVGISLFTIIQVHAQITTQFGGPNRNGIYNETGLLDKWPEGGPELMETIRGIGKGYASPSVTENGIFIAGMIDSIGHIFHFDNNYKLKWKTEIGGEFNFKYVGSRVTPTIEGNRLYYVASRGDAVCLNMTTGEKIWHVNIMDRYQGQKVKWGYTESPLVYGEKIFFTPGGPGSNFVAHDKMSGEMIWALDIDSAKNSYCSPVIINHNNKDLILLNTSYYILLIDPGNGDIIVKHPLTHFQANHTLPPIYTDGKLFYSSGYGEGTTLFQIVEGKIELDTIYSNKDLDPRKSVMILYEGTVFSTSHRKKQWVGVDFNSGETVFTSRDLKPGSLIQADNKFYLYSEFGEVALATPSKTGFEIVSRFQIPADDARFTFAHLVIHNGILFIRHNENLWLYNVKK